MSKGIFSTLLLLAFAGSLAAQGSHHHAPSAVKHAFHRDYPEAQDPQWSSSHGQWSADFNDRSPYDRGEMIAHYDQNGHHVDSHIPYDRNDVPTAVVEQTERSYPDARDYNYTRIESPGRHPVFQVSLNLHGSNKMLYVDDNGREKEYHDHH
jgi:hypothetical protein